MQALVCPLCGAPLPLAVASLPLTACAYCGATLRHEAGGLVGHAGTAEPGSEEAHAERRRAFLAALAPVSLDHTDPYAVLRDAARAHLGSLGETDAVARVTLAIAADFEATSGAAVRRDPKALARIAEAYLLAIEGLRSAQRATINLPFLGTGHGVPVHLVREVTVSELAAFAAREPSPPTPVAPAASAPSPTPPPKRGWWPFG